MCFKSIYRFSVLIILMVASWISAAESFNTGEVINFSGKKGVLADDEGYLYLSLKTNTNISRITLDAVGLGKKIRFNDIKEGQNYALLKVKAGEYYWEHINIFVGIGAIRMHRKKDDYPFTVKPGVVNYPGSWVFNAKWVENFRARTTLENYNYLSYETAHYEDRFKNLIGSYPFEYQGQIKDPYAAFLSQAIEQADTNNLPNLYYQEKDKEKLPMTFFDKDSPTNLYQQAYPTVNDYFHYDNQSIRSVSPDGSFLLFHSILDDVVSIGLIGVDNFTTYLLYQQKLPAQTRVSELAWIDHDSFFLTLTNQDIDRSYVAHLDIDKTQSTIKAQFLKFREEGMLLDGLIKEQNMIFFVKEMKNTSSNNNGLFKVDVTDESSIDKSFRKNYKKTRKLRNVVDWLVDSQGEVRAAITIEFNKKDEGINLDYWFLPELKSNKWKKIKTLEQTDHLFWLLSLSADESYFLVLTNEFSDKMSVHKYSTQDGSHLGLVYEDPDHDIQGLKIDPVSREIVAYYYFENGVLQAHYFKTLDKDLIQAQQENPDLQLFEVTKFADKSLKLLYGHTPNTKGAWYLFDSELGSADKIFDTSPNYEQLPKGKYQVIKTKAEDGVELEGFLVLPSNNKNQKYPLVVMPHGGPIGVRDFAHNSEMQHFFASQGIATLKVNFRGSSGYGKKFLEMGKQQWGEKIEQDIFTVTQEAIKKYDIDGSKICAMGGSYGGYSSLMLTYLYPDTYRCAISFAGVTDLPLLFTSRDLTRDPYMKEVLAEIVGNPDQEIEKLVSKSPLYLLKEMKRPLLFFQGLDDSTVRPEHVFRIQQLISLYGMDHKVFIFEDEGHSYSQQNTPILYMVKSLEFIQKHLKLE